MMKKSLVLIPLLLVVGVLLTGAWPSSSTPSASNACIDFVPQVLPLNCPNLEGKITAQQLLEAAIDTLSKVRTGWLKTKIRQTMLDAESKFVADGFLQRGPNHCARLELKVMADETSSRLLVVSDGEVLAEERTIVNLAPKIESEDLPEIDAAKPGRNAPAREAYLANKGCGGPLCVLQQLQPCLQNLTLKTGLLRGQPVIRLKGDWPAQKAPGFARTTIPLQFCYLYLDAKTLWPHRVEWWGVDKSRCLRSIMQLEFEDGVVNQELTPQECVRMFSYQPAQAASP